MDPDDEAQMMGRVALGDVQAMRCLRDGWSAMMSDPDCLMPFEEAMGAIEVMHRLAASVGDNRDMMALAAFCLIRSDAATGERREALINDAEQAIEAVAATGDVEAMAVVLASVEAATDRCPENADGGALLAAVISYLPADFALAATRRAKELRRD